MMEHFQVGKVLIITGIIIVTIGLVVYFFGNNLHWLGNLPGDIKIEKESFKFYFPITTMIILSVLISVIVKIIHKFF